MRSSEQRRHEAAPSELQPVYRRHPETGALDESMLRWGFIPHGSAARPAIRPLHVRAETIAEKPMFADAYRKRRCIVPMNSFYQKDPKGRRHVISRRDGALFPVAGIWDNWLDRATGRWDRTFAIVTVEPNEAIAKIHDRMPAILDMKDVARWLSDEADPCDLLRPYPSELLSVVPAKARTRRQHDAASAAPTFV